MKNKPGHADFDTNAGLIIGQYLGYIPKVIGVKRIPSNYRVSKWWFETSKPGVKGIAEWETITQED